MQGSKGGRATPALQPADKVVITYLIVIASLVTAFSFRISPWPWLLALHALGVAIVVAIASLDRRLNGASPESLSSPSPLLPSPPAPLPPCSPTPWRKAAVLRFIHGWYPVALIPTTYKELSYLIPLIHPRDFDPQLAAIDLRVFGVHPSVWLERLTHPAITEVLQLVYATYYFLPIVVGAVLWRQRRFLEYRFWVFVVAFGFFVSYLGYISIPATGPRFLPSINDAQTFPLTGVWLFQSLRETLDHAEGITRDCFPSGHTEVTLLVLFYARRFHRRTFQFLLPIGSALIASTVYLRYHYVIDVIAGAVIAAAVILIAEPLFRAIGGPALRPQTDSGGGQEYTPHIQ